MRFPPRNEEKNVKQNRFLGGILEKINVSNVRYVQTSEEKHKLVSPVTYENEYCISNHNCDLRAFSGFQFIMF